MNCSLGIATPRRGQADVAIVDTWIYHMVYCANTRRDPDVEWYFTDPRLLTVGETRLILSLALVQTGNVN